MEHEVRATWDGRDARVLVHYDREPGLAEAAHANDIVRRWIAGDIPAMHVPPGARVEVYGVPKAGGAGLVYETRCGDAHVRFEAPDLDALKKLMAEVAGPAAVTRSQTPGEPTDPPRGVVNHVGNIITAIADSAPYDGGIVGGLDHSGRPFSPECITREFLGSVRSACDCPPHVLKARGCVCGK